MKRILALLLATITLLSLVSCSSGLATEETGAEMTATATKEEAKTEEKTEE